MEDIKIYVPAEKSIRKESAVAVAGDTVSIWIPSKQRG